MNDFTEIKLRGRRLPLAASFPRVSGAAMKTRPRRPRRHSQTTPDSRNHLSERNHNTKYETGMDTF